MDYKKCKHCKETKELQQFSLDRSSKNGHQKYCKECNKHFSRE